jgi:hypothetical protein
VLTLPGGVYSGGAQPGNYNDLVHDFETALAHPMLGGDAAGPLAAAAAFGPDAAPAGPMGAAAAPAGPMGAAAAAGPDAAPAHGGALPPNLWRPHGNEAHGTVLVAPDLTMFAGVPTGIMHVRANRNLPVEIVPTADQVLPAIGDLNM